MPNCLPSKLEEGRKPIAMVLIIMRGRPSFCRLSSTCFGLSGKIGPLKTLSVS